MTEIEFFQQLQKLCPPGLWSRGMNLFRANSIIQEGSGQDEKIYRVQDSGRSVGFKVTLWPEDEDWFCDCESKSPICSHVAASAIFLNHVLSARPSESLAATQGSTPSESPSPVAPPKPNWVQLRYEFRRIHDALAMDRWLVSPTGKKELLTQSLVGLVGGINSGRIKSLPIATVKQDFGIDAILTDRRRGELQAEVLAKLIKALTGFANVFLDGTPITTSNQMALTRVTVEDEGPGFRLKLKEDPSITEPFVNGAALCGRTLKAMEVSRLTSLEQKLFVGKGKYFGPAEVRNLVLEFLPLLKKKIPVEILSQNLPEIKIGEPKIILELQQGRPANPAKGQRDETDILSVLPILAYDHENRSGFNSGTVGTRPGAVNLESIRRPVPIFQPDPAAEKLLHRKLQNELQLTVGQTTRFQGIDAVKFTERLSGWQTSGNGMAAFGLKKELAVRLDVQDGKINVFFETLEGLENQPESSGNTALEASLQGFENNTLNSAVQGLSLGDTAYVNSAVQGQARQADPNRVFQAWRENQSYVPLLGGGWAPLPKDWLNRYGSRIISLLAAKNAKQELPAYLVPSITQLCEETGNSYPEALKKLKQQLQQIETIPEAVPPKDLQVPLRHYQQLGLNWLCFLRDTNMGALLADDMGLGKTLQAICSIQGRTLIIAPTSVLPNWTEQISSFRPDLTYSVFYGSQRVLDEKAQVVITSYALLRLNKDLLGQETWDTVILDEAQTIKNPWSQTARAAHTLKANFRLALSGTPVENHLSDLWSLFNFINPGLLGALDDFHETFAQAINKGDPEAAHQLRTRIRPFILRRLKKEVAPELPPRTETVLYCELDQHEQDLYNSLLAAARQDVLEKLETQGNVFAALELLLRLRQACCHSALVPGQLQMLEEEEDSKRPLETLRALKASEGFGALDHLDTGDASQFPDSLSVLDHLTTLGSTKSLNQNGPKGRGDWLPERDLNLAPLSSRKEPQLDELGVPETKAHRELKKLKKEVTSTNDSSLRKTSKTKGQSKDKTKAPKIKPSSKVNLLISTLKESIELGHRSLIFSQWTSYLDLIQTALDDNGITWLRLDGSTRNRAEIVNQFQTEPKYQTMLISLKAGGTGLNLTAADHVFLMDPWWNPAVEDQAADRAHRIGQENPVLIHRLVAQGTVEERILTLQKAKSQIAEAVLQGSGASITKADLLNLLR